MQCLVSNTHSQSVSIAGQEIKYNKKGSGIVIVLLPPPLLDHSIYCEIQDKLSKNYNTVSVDLPRAVTVDEVIKILVEVINKGTNQPFHLIASSATGWIAQFVAPYFKGQIQSLILINSFHSNQNYGKTYKVALKSTKLLPGFKFKKEVVKRSEFLRSGLPQKDTIDNYFKRRVEALDKDGVREQMGWFVSEKELPPKLTIPLLLLTPRKDPIIKKKEYQELVDYHQNVTRKELTTNAHLLFVANKEDTIMQITEFINS